MIRRHGMPGIAKTGGAVSGNSVKTIIGTGRIGIGIPGAVKPVEGLEGEPKSICTTGSPKLPVHN